MRLDKRTRLLLLIGLVVVLAVGCVFVYLPGGGDEQPDPREVIALLEAEEKAAKQDPPSATTRTGETPSKGGAAPRAPGPRHESRAAIARHVTRMAQRPKPEYLSALKKAARSSDEAIREPAMVGLGRLGENSDPQPLMTSLANDESAAVRIAAATALGNLRHWEAGPILIDALEDPDPRVRSQAGASLDKIIGVKLGFRATDPKRDRVIEKIRAWWPRFYAGYLARKAGG